MLQTSLTKIKGPERRLRLREKLVELNLDINTDH